MVFLGIDPGLSGGWALVGDDAIEAEPTPILKSGSRREYDENDMVAIVENIKKEFHKRVHAIIEAQQSMPLQGVKSTFRIGFGYGLWRGILAAKYIPYEVVRPKEWQGFFGFKKGDTKVQSIEKAQQLFPHISLLATERSKKKHDGMADALLIAEYGRRKFRGET